MDFNSQVLCQLPIPDDLHWNIAKYLSHPLSKKIKTVEFAYKIISKKILYCYMHLELNYFYPENLVDTEDSSNYIS